MSASCDGDSGCAVTAIAGYAVVRMRAGTVGEADAAGARTGPED